MPSLNIRVPQGWHLFFVDNPGFNEYKEFVNETANFSVKVSSACIFVTTYDGFHQMETTKFLQESYNANKGM